MYRPIIGGAKCIVPPTNILGEGGHGLRGPRCSATMDSLWTDREDIHPIRYLIWLLVFSVLAGTSVNKFA